MRVAKKETKVYKFDELSESAKDTVLQEFYNVNVDYDWWQWTYEDAENVGIKLTGFDIGRSSHCRGEFYENAEDVAQKIIKQHGESCETHQTAKSFLNDVNGIDVDSGEFDALATEFRLSILEDYRIILQKEYEYLTSKEAIVATIAANEYEFEENGKLY